MWCSAVFVSPEVTGMGNVQRGFASIPSQLVPAVHPGGPWDLGGKGPWVVGHAAGYTNICCRVC